MNIFIVLEQSTYSNHVFRSNENTLSYIDSSTTLWYTFLHPFCVVLISLHSNWNYPFLSATFHHSSYSFTNKKEFTNFIYFNTPNSSFAWLHVISDLNWPSSYPGGSPYECEVSFFFFFFFFSFIHNVAVLHLHKKECLQCRNEWSLLWCSVCINHQSIFRSLSKNIYNSGTAYVKQVTIKRYSIIQQLWQAVVLSFWSRSCAWSRQCSAVLSLTRLRV